MRRPRSGRFLENYAIIQKMDDEPRSLAERLKPAASVRVQLGLSGLMWVCVGTGLMIAGCRWVLRSTELLYAAALIPALALGILKSRFVLDKAARRISVRILLRGEGKCIGGFLSPLSWFLVLLMAGGGRLLRAGPVPRFWIGLLYAGIGVGLMRSSRIFLRYFRENHSDGVA